MTREELIELMENTWGEDEEVVDSLLAFFNNDTELIANILENDRSFNRYSCCYDWYDLGVEIISDEAFLADLDSTSYIEMVSAAVDKGEESVKELLISHNWAIDTNTGVAIGFDDDIILSQHEVV